MWRLLWRFRCKLHVPQLPDWTTTPSISLADGRSWSLKTTAANMRNWRVT